MGAHQRVSIEEITNAYRETGSVWKAGKRLGISGQSVHERLKSIDYPMLVRRWTAEEDGELDALLAAGLPAGKIGSRLGRTFAAVTCRMNQLELRVQPSPADPKIPRGAGYDKASINKHLSAIERAEVPPTRYCRANAMSIDVFVAACQQHFPERWEQYLATHNGLERKTCPYCSREFVPANGKQIYCTRKCGGSAITDANYFGGKRRQTIGLAEGVCQLCGAHKTKGLSSHHMLGKDNDPENECLIALCAGCHKIVTMLSTRNFLDDGSSWETLIQLCWMRKNGPRIASGDLDRHWFATYVEIGIEEMDEDDLAELEL